MHLIRSILISAFFVTAVTRAIAAPAAKKGAPTPVAKPVEANPPSLDETKFDLDCAIENAQTHAPLTSIHFRLDLSAAQWCRTDLGCDNQKPLIVFADQIWFYRSSVSTTPLGVQIIDNWIDRQTGMYHWDRTGQTEYHSVGVCRKIPYGSEIPNKF